MIARCTLPIPLPPEAPAPRIDTSDRPFALPPAEICLDILVPPSTNLTRRHNPAAWGKIERWKVATDKMLMASGQYRAAKGWAARNDSGRFEIKIILSEQCRLDLDNPTKSAIDYLRRIQLIRNDDKRYLRKLTVVWGFAPSGCRILLREAA